MGAALAVTAGLSVVALHAVARADSTDSGQVVLQLKFKPGDALKYQTNMKLGFTLPSFGAATKTAAHGGQSGGELGGTNFTVNAVQEIKVRAAAPTGGGDLDVTTTGQNTLPGQPPVISNDTRPVRMSYDALGKLTSIKRQGETASSNPMFSAMLGQGLLCLQGVMLPAKPVRVGETWSQHVQIPNITGNGASTVKTTLTRIEYLNKYKTAHLHVVITTPVSAYLDAALQPVAKPSGAASAMTGTAVVTDEINFALAEGRVVRSIGKGVTNMTVAIGKPAVPDAAPGKRRKKGAPPVVVVSTAKPAQTLKMTVTSDIETYLEDSSKKPGGGA
jgi:YD repeat-containing protein